MSGNDIQDAPNRVPRPAYSCFAGVVSQPLTATRALEMWVRSFTANKPPAAQD